MKTYVLVLVSLWAFVFGHYVGFSKGADSIKFDRERANVMLQNCQELILKKEF